MRWPRSLSVVLLVGTLTTGVSAPAVAAMTVVHPTGVFPDDVQAVQAAVDAGGTVLLSGVSATGTPTAFDFGPADGTGGRVFLTDDVVIVGQSSGGAPPTITGGFIPFFGTEPVRTRIEGLTFDAPLLSAMIFLRSTGTEVVDNHIVGVVGLELFFGPTEGRGIKFLGNSDPAGAITGRVLVEGNRIEGSAADFDEAIVLDAVAADVEIRGNTTRGDAGVLVIAPGGAVEITRNDIDAGPGNGSPDNFGNGMQLLGGNGEHPYRVSGNRIVCRNPFADALVLAGGSFFGPSLDGLVIEHNDIDVVSDFAGISLFGEVDDTLVANNRVAGAATWALGLLPLFPGDTATDVSFVGNRVVGFDAAFADTVVFSHATGTRVVGNAGDVFDIGTDTLITGSVRGDGGLDLGPRLREARARVDVVTGGGAG